MKVLFYLGHPAHYHLFRHAIHAAGAGGVVLIKSKDVLETLLKEEGIPYVNIDEVAAGKVRTKNLADKSLAFFRRILRIREIIKRHQPAVLAGSAAELAVLGKIYNIPSCIFFEDDFEAVKPFARIAGPFATHLICPDCCSAWKWNHKKTGHDSYHELAYLHPDHFTPDRTKVEKIFSGDSKNFILRFSSLDAYHDNGKGGISDSIADRLIEILAPLGKIFITSERILPERFEKYRISIPVADIHHALFYADLFIGDSQTMTAECAVLGTPSLRYNDFVGELSYLEELEHTYGLTFGFRTGNIEPLLQKLQTLLQIIDLKGEWKSRRQKMLQQKCNFADWMISYLQKF
jgi:predicted glycosyltransferase